MKENQSVKPVVNVDAGTVTFEVKGMSPLVLEMSRLHPDIIKRAALVGMAQVRIVDAAAVGRADEDGNLIPEGDRLQTKYDRMAALIEHYHSGTAEWSRRAEGGGGRVALALEALAELKGMSVEKAEEGLKDFAAKKFNNDTKEALKYLAQGERMQKKILEIRTRRAGAGKVDADQALSEI